ncbi:ATP-binding cassette domain-containing protein [Chryseobacterium sp. SSA4.19]|uniref:ATP-binding cassette domain-containing protein n=1 Tax=Chryseobacterium sp. SSA4.19 TaxID=2919915 RepID=UPI001F4D6A05|nr:ATP-binding cassette domain-containing protein [Chryseobacterium sp. SSA4.19]MCJ8154543.1 ATP-binding cassette domain-containing protein [Chryseobacterium sp. SSA4.19]
MIDISIRHRIFTSSGNTFLEVEEKIEEGSIVHVSGDSGIGKTTFFKILSGLVLPDFGLIKKGNEILSDTQKKIFLPPQKRDMAFMFQNYALFPNMTVKQNIAFAGKEKAIDKIDDFLEKFNLKSLENILPEKLSGGQQQRVALARALVQNASVILLDEPFSAVDPVIRKIMKNELIKKVQNSKATAFVISHNEDEFKDIRHFKLMIK